MVRAALSRARTWAAITVALLPLAAACTTTRVVVVPVKTVTAAPSDTPTTENDPTSAPPVTPADHVRVDVRNLVPVVEQAYADGNNKYPPSVSAGPGGTITIAGNPTPISDGTRITYTRSADGGWYCIIGFNPAADVPGHTLYYRSTTGQTVAGDPPADC